MKICEKCKAPYWDEGGHRCRDAVDLLIDYLNEGRYIDRHEFIAAVKVVLESMPSPSPT